jgi:hypothetical protein
MADHAQRADYHHGDMPTTSHADTYRGVMGLFKWGSLAVADLLILLVLSFCTSAGAVSSLVLSAIVLGAGVLALRSPKSPAH